MIRKRRIKRDTRLYKRANPARRAINTMVFLLIIAALVALGFMAGQEITKRIKSGDYDTSSISSIPTSPNPTSSADEPSSEASSSNPISSEYNQNIGTFIAKFMPYTVYEGKSQDEIKQWIDTAKTEGFNTILVELKDEDGVLHYASSNPMAGEYKAVSPNAVDATMLVRLINEAGLQPNACMSALKDRTAPSVARENSYAYGDQLDVNWWDNSAANGGKPWLNPYMPNTRKYLSDLSQEMIGFGFKEITLTNVMFPDKNTEKMNVIQESMTRKEILLKVVFEAAQPASYGVWLPSNPEEARTAINEALDGYGGVIGISFFIKEADLNALKPVLEQNEVDDYVIY